MGHARRGQRRPEVFDGLDEILRESELHRGIGPYEFSVLKKLRETAWGSA